MEENSRLNYLQSRPRHPRDEAARFIETRIAPASEATPVYHERLNGFVLLDKAEKPSSSNIGCSAEMWKEADKDIQELLRMTEDLRKKLTKEKATGNVTTLAKEDLRNCTWEEVMGEVEATSTLWRTSTIKSTKTMQYIDKVGQNSEAFQSWLELLPAGDYGSSIAGVFKVVIGAAGRYTKIEETVFKALSDIPEAMESARRYVQIYDENQDRSLEKKTFNLFRTILRALIQIMKFFTDSKTREFIIYTAFILLFLVPSVLTYIVVSYPGKVFQTLLQQNTYKTDLMDSIEDVKEYTARVLEEAHRCHQERSRNHERISLQTNQNSEKHLQHQEATIRILSDMHRVFKESLVLKHKTAAASRIPSQSLPTQPSEITASRVLEAIRYDPKVVAKDIQATIQRGLALEEQPKAVAASLVTHPRFDAYFGPAAGSGVGQPASSALLVNGRMDPTTSEGVSPLGLVVAEVTRVSTGRPGAYVVSYFCDRHRPGFRGPSTEEANPVTAMVASFIGQLLTQIKEQQQELDFTFLKEEDWPRLRRGRLNTLCVVFLALVTQLPPGSVLLCMIDGASQYETVALSTSMEALTRRLVRLVSNSQRGDEEQEQRPVYKLLVTCQTRARGISQYFDQDGDHDGGGILNLDGDIEATDSSSRRIASLRNVG
ncbi:uncharacterized protein PG998_004713 [Apiospora kogelbergensis]|uniref:uncharacterized protein n=1 Tax=Apiospora kogelbergensis TaxID=1337665 RepID=UPI00312FCC6A